NRTDVPNPDVETRSTTRPSVFPVQSDPLTEQQRLIREQDNQLDQLGTSISTLKGMSRRIGDELEDQVGLLDDFNSEMVHTESRLDQATKRTARLLRLGTDRRQWCAIGTLTVTLLIILILLAVL
ncbi:Syntaxin 6, partial [Fasciola hepatica]